MFSNLLIPFPPPPWSPPFLNINGSFSINQSLQITHSSRPSSSIPFSQGSGIFSAELYGILKALESIYALDQLPPCIHIFSDSSSAIKTLSSPKTPILSCILEIRNLLKCLLSSGTKIIYLIPSHSGIIGNEIVDNLASDESDPSSRSLIENTLSIEELISSSKSSWKKSLLAHVHKCKKIPAFK